MSEYSKFNEGQLQEYLCPACGGELSEKEETEDGYYCPRCRDFIPKEAVIDPFKGLSNKHKPSSLWR